MFVIRYLVRLVISLASVAQGQEVDSVLVIKSTSKMYLIANGVRVKDYSIALVGNPKGRKK